MTRHAERSLKTLVIVLAVSAAAATAASAETARYRILPDRSKVEYVSGTQLGEFRGATGQVSGEIVFDPAAPARAEASIAVNAPGLRSDNAVRDQHLHDKVLDTGRFPAITLTAREFKPAPTANGEKGEGLLVGVLSLHGVERPVSIPIQYTLRNGVLQATARFSITLTDFAVVPPRMLGLTVRNQVAVEASFVAAGAPR